MKKYLSVNSRLYFQLVVSIVLFLIPLSALIARADSQISDFFIKNPLLKGQELKLLEQVHEAHDSFMADPVISKLLETVDQELLFTQHFSIFGMETLRFQQRYKGLEVLGGQILRHTSVNSLAGASVSNYLSAFDLDVKPKLTQAEAIAIAQTSHPNKSPVSLPTLKLLPSPDGYSARLIYWVTMEGAKTGADLLIDAQSGKVIADLDEVMTIAPVDVYAANDTCQSVNLFNGAPNVPDPEKCELILKAGVYQEGSDLVARQALKNSLITLNYYSNNFKRDSFDAQGAKLVNLVHAGKNYNNAFWNRNKNYMGYGDGDARTYRNFTNSLDVAGHELTHGITIHTAGLLYFNESGALNEAFSDFFGKMISDDGDWLLGKELFIEGSKGKAFRNLKDPGSLQYETRDEHGSKVSGGYPAHLKDRVGTAEVGEEACGGNNHNDNCWVHINSTIMSHAGYLVVEAIGKEKAQKLWYLVLTQYLSATAGFVTARNATVQACAELFDSSTCDSVAQAFRQVGL